MHITQRELPVKSSWTCRSPDDYQRTIDKFCVKLEGARHSMHELNEEEGGIVHCVYISRQDSGST